MDNVILKKENGVVTFVASTPEIKQSMDDTCHLCWEYCANADPRVCPKIKDRKKKYISEYDFITDGYQVLDENSGIEKFVVSKCDKYKKVKPKARTVEEIARLRKIRDELRKQYFEVETVEEAYVIQHDLAKRGLITNIRGRMPREEEIIRMRKRIR